ncbi:MAG: hypothetical protein U0Y10_14400 [Spirosomataceae bacterium]
MGSGPVLMNSVPSVTPGCQYLYSLQCFSPPLGDCQFSAKFKNAQGFIDDTNYPYLIGGYVTWANVSGNAEITITSVNCQTSSSNGATATGSRPIVDLGNPSNLLINGSSNGQFSCGIQTVTFTATAGSNAFSNEWDYSELTSNGWQYVSGQGSTSLVMQSSQTSGGTIIFKSKKDCKTKTISLTITRPTGQNASIIGDDFICTGSKNYSVINLPTGATIQSWSYPASLSGSCSTCNPISLTITGASSGTISATINNGTCGTFTRNKTIRVGQYQPSEMTISGQSSLCLNQQYTFSCPFLSSTSSDYNWQISPSSSFSYYSSSNAFFVTPNSPGYSTVTVRVQNICGWPSVPATYNISQSSCYGFRFSSSPNPTTNQLAVAATVVDEKGNEIERKATDTYPEFSYKLLNEQGVTLLEGASDKLNALLDLKKLPKGIYYLHLNDGKTITKQRIGKE